MCTGTGAGRGCLMECHHLGDFSNDTCFLTNLGARVKDQDDVVSTGFSWSFRHSLQMVMSSCCSCVCTYVPGVAVSFPVFSYYTLGPALMTSFYFNYCIKDLLSSRRITKRTYPQVQSHPEVPQCGLKCINPRT